jgi:hypothetical protein
MLTAALNSRPHKHTNKTLNCPRESSVVRERHRLRNDMDRANCAHGSKLKKREHQHQNVYQFSHITVIPNLGYAYAQGYGPGHLGVREKN